MGLEQSLTVNQNLIENTIKLNNDKLNKMKKLVKEDKIELKKHFRIKEDCSWRNNIRIHGIPENKK